MRDPTDVVRTFIDNDPYSLKNQFARLDARLEPLEETSMKEYHKIQTVYLRDPITKFQTLLLGQFAEPEFEYLKDNLWEFTEKVDGTNIRVIINDGRLSFGGKSDNAQIPARLVNRLEAIFFPQADILRVLFPDGGCLYGEGYGASIQKDGGNYRASPDFVLFDVKVGDWWLQRSGVEIVAEKLELDIVPDLGTGTLATMTEMVREGFDSQWGAFKAEGIVARPIIELKKRNGHRIITKLKTKDFAKWP